MPKAASAVDEDDRTTGGEIRNRRRQGDGPTNNEAAARAQNQQKNGQNPHSQEFQSDSHGESVQGYQDAEGFFDRGFTVQFYIPYWLCGIGTLLVILLAVLIAIAVILVRGPPPFIENGMMEVEERAGRAGVDAFQAYDLNRDGFLSIYEFEPLIPHLINVSTLIEEFAPMEMFLNYTLKEGEEALVLHAHFTPLQFETMTKEDILKMDLSALWVKAMRLYLRFAKYSLMPIITGKNSLSGLKTWNEVNKEHLIFGASEFRKLLPDDLENLEAGLAYDIIESNEGGYFSRTHQSSSRYFPSKPRGKEETLYRLLGMMHPRPFVQMRFAPRGTVGCVRAISDKYVHVLFRMHAEFQLNNPPHKPFWFTPAQFVGDLVMSLDGTHVHYFHMSVPSERRLNVDMEWLTGEGDDGMEVDIGYMPRMEWTMDSESHLPLPEEDGQTLRPDLPPPQHPEDVAWTSQVTREECVRKIEKEFYPFKEVTYHNLTQAVRLSRAENRPLHAVFLWGALDDQSC